jgi:hypothetical protein
VSYNTMHNWLRKEKEGTRKVQFQEIKSADWLMGGKSERILEMEAKGITVRFYRECEASFLKEVIAGIR